MSADRGIVKSGIFGLLLLYALIGASTADEARSQYHYTIFCQGCHGPDGSGASDVPRLKDYAGYFLSVEGGREFIVQVPGSANAPIDDQSLAELLNWMLQRFSAGQMPEQFEAYTGEEIGRLRRQPVIDVVEIRARLVVAIERLRSTVND